MGTREVHFCDFCKKEFDSAGTFDEPMKVTKLAGNRHTDTAGNISQNEIILEINYQRN